MQESFEGISTFFIRYWYAISFYCTALINSFLLLFELQVDINKRDAHPWTCVLC